MPCTRDAQHEDLVTLRSQPAFRRADTTTATSAARHNVVASATRNANSDPPEDPVSLAASRDRLREAGTRARDVRADCERPACGIEVVVVGGRVVDVVEAADRVVADKSVADERGLAGSSLKSWKFATLSLAVPELLHA